MRILLIVRLSKDMFPYNNNSIGTQHDLIAANASITGYRSGLGSGESTHVLHRRFASNHTFINVVNDHFKTDTNLCQQLSAPRRG